ncbi:MAG: RNA methyltransferase [Desulfovibrionaceae bacterium]|nr:RNA methyltransferase [Desulfovibrionaceae bacterium]
MLKNVAVVLFRPRYPENVGSVARACLNMGCAELLLVDPVDFDPDRARTLATVHAGPLLERARIVEDLASALSGFSAVFGTTARTGGWRKGVATPDQAAAAARDQVGRGGRVAFVFGPEDRGLTNEQTRVCTGLVTIPTADRARSLNLAQAVVIVLYECFRRFLDEPFTAPGPPLERPVTHEESEELMEGLRQTLLAIDFLRSDNPDYWMLPVRRFLARVDLRRNEFNLLMGVCRQVRWMSGDSD